MKAALAPSFLKTSAAKVPDFPQLLAREGLHEVFPSQPVDAAAATCFALGLLPQKRLVWLRQSLAQVELGAPYAPGLVSLGHDPSHIIYLPLRDATSVLQAGLEVARSTGDIAALLELWGPVPAYGLTASRKLALAAKASGATLFLVNHAASPMPSAAETRWQVRRLPSRVWTANAPGLPAFEVTLLRHRSSTGAGKAWSVEWNHERRCFEERTILKPAAAPPLFKPVVSVPVFRKIPLRKAA